VSVALRGHNRRVVSAIVDAGRPAGPPPAARAPFDPESQQLARHILVSFLFTFIAARVVVFLIVARRIPDGRGFVGWPPW
jgi:hypothetical protein